MSRLSFKARCTRSHQPQVLLVGRAETGQSAERYFALDPEEAVVLAGELLESARQAYRLSSEQHHAPTVPVTARAEVCRHVPEHCPLPVCLCRPYPIPMARMQLLCDLRKLVAPFGFRNFWVATVSETEAEDPTLAGSPSAATSEPAIPAAGR